MSGIVCGLILAPSCTRNVTHVTCVLMTVPSCGAWTVPGTATLRLLRQLVRGWAAGEGCALVFSAPCRPRARCSPVWTLCETREAMRAI